MLQSDARRARDASFQRAESKGLAGRLVSLTAAIPGRAVWFGRRFAELCSLLTSVPVSGS